MKNKKLKEDILKLNPELRLSENGDFYIDKNIIDKYEIIDFHCHIFEGLECLFPKILRTKRNNIKKSLMDLSCFPFSIKLFDLDSIYFTKCPDKLLSVDGIKTKFKLFGGVFGLNYATSERLLYDMDKNGIDKSVILQINPKNNNSSLEMENIILDNQERLYTFGSINPFDDNIDDKIKDYMKLHIIGWKLNPHICGYDIDCKQSLNLIKKLSDTGLPILCCSGLGLPNNMIESAIVSNKMKRDIYRQNLDKYIKVLEENPNTTFVLAHSGCYEFDKIIPILKRFENVYTDISIQPSKNIRALINEVGADRLLFGTDYPFVTQAFSILSVLRATSDEVERNKIFSENAKKIMKVKK